MSVLDATIIAVAPPSIQTDLSLSASALSWVVDAYVLTFGGFLLLAGRLADLSGRRLYDIPRGLEPRNHTIWCRAVQPAVRLRGAEGRLCSTTC
jgi:MFS family permease